MVNKLQYIIELSENIYMFTNNYNGSVISTYELIIQNVNLNLQFLKNLNIENKSVYQLEPDYVQVLIHILLQ